MVLKFKIGYEEKRRTCNELLSKDKKGVAKVAENKTQMQKLMEDVEKLKETDELRNSEEKRLSGLRQGREGLTKELHDTHRLDYEKPYYIVLQPHPNLGATIQCSDFSSTKPAQKLLSM